MIRYKITKHIYTEASTGHSPAVKGLLPWGGVVTATETGSQEEGSEGPRRRRKRGVGKLSGPEKQWQPFPCGASARPASVLGRGPGRQAGGQQEGWTSTPFVLKVPRRRDHWPFLAWALRASGNSSRTIISGGMCYSSIFPESQAVSHKIRNVSLRPPQLQGILRSSGGHRGLPSQESLGGQNGVKETKSPLLP